MSRGVVFHLHPLLYQHDDVRLLFQNFAIGKSFVSATTSKCPNVTMSIDAPINRGHVWHRVTSKWFAKNSMNTKVPKWKSIPKVQNTLVSILRSDDGGRSWSMVARDLLRWSVQFPLPIASEKKQGPRVTQTSSCYIFFLFCDSSCPLGLELRLHTHISIYIHLFLLFKTAWEHPWCVVSLHDQTFFLCIFLSLSGTCRPVVRPCFTTMLVHAEHAILS